MNSRERNTAIVLVAVALGVCAGVGVCIVEFAQSQKQSEVTNSAVLAKNDQALKACAADERQCIGGFVKWHSSGEIARINYCGAFGCRAHDMSVTAIVNDAYQHPHPLAPYFDWVVLHDMDPARWGEVSAEYRHQFGVHRRQ